MIMNSVKNISADTFHSVIDNLGVCHIELLPEVICSVREFGNSFDCRIVDQRIDDKVISEFSAKNLKQIQEAAGVVIKTLQ
jgi:hypothetical protein